MKCLFCEKRTKIINTRRSTDGRQYRRRECLHCKERFTTYEINQMFLFDLLEEYLPERLIDEISRAVSKGVQERNFKKDW